MRTERVRLSVCMVAVTMWALAGCGASKPKVTHDKPKLSPTAARASLPWESQLAEQPLRSTAVIAIVGGTVWTAAGDIITDGVVVLEKGRIRAVGTRASVAIPDDAFIVDATGKHVTPGFIDTHSHMGVYAVPSINSTDDGNEATGPVTAQVWAADSFWPQDPSLSRALAGGITTIEVLPGSANLIGGRGVTMKLRPGRSVSEMRFPGALDTLKMACGENPKNVYGSKGSAPSTRMGNVAGYRAAFQSAVEYRRKWRAWLKKETKWQAKQAEGGKKKDDDEEPDQPDRDFAMDALSGVLDGRVLVQMHCYRADEMVRMMEIAHEFGFHIRSFHHAVEAYKIRDLLLKENVAVSTWPDWWGFKLEAFDAIPENLALITAGGGRAILHSDSEMLIQRFGQEAGKAQAFGARSGITITDNQAIRWVTANPAWALGIDRDVGTLEVGKMADVVVWSGRPLSVYSHAERVFIDGELLYDRTKNPRGQGSDFELGWEGVQ